MEKKCIMLETTMNDLMQDNATLKASKGKRANTERKTQFRELDTTNILPSAVPAPALGSGLRKEPQGRLPAQSTTMMHIRIEDPAASAENNGGNNDVSVSAASEKLGRRGTRVPGTIMKKQQP